MSDLTITTNELLIGSGALRAIGGYDLPDVKGAYALAKIKRAANAALTDVVTTQTLLWDKHHRTPEGTFAPEDQPGFEADWTALLEEPVTLSGCRALLVSELEGATQVVRFPDDPKRIEVIRGLPSDLLFALGPFVVEPSPPDAAK